MLTFLVQPFAIWRWLDLLHCFCSDLRRTISYFPERIVNTRTNSSPLSPKAHGMGRGQEEMEYSEQPKRCSPVSSKTTMTLLPRNPVIGWHIPFFNSVMCLRINQPELWLELLKQMSRAHWRAVRKQCGTVVVILGCGATLPGFSYFF